MEKENVFRKIVVNSLLGFPITHDKLCRDIFNCRRKYI